MKTRRVWTSPSRKCLNKIFAMVLNELVGLKNCGCEFDIVANSGLTRLEMKVFLDILFIRIRDDYYYFEIFIVFFKHKYINRSIHAQFYHNNRLFHNYLDNSFSLSFLFQVIRRYYINTISFDRNCFFCFNYTRNTCSEL